MTGFSSIPPPLTAATCEILQRIVDKVQVRNAGPVKKVGLSNASARGQARSERISNKDALTAAQGRIEGCGVETQAGRRWSTRGKQWTSGRRALPTKCSGLTSLLTLQKTHCLRDILRPCKCRWLGVCEIVWNGSMFRYSFEAKQYVNCFWLLVPRLAPTPGVCVYPVSHRTLAASTCQVLSHNLHSTRAWRSSHKTQTPIALERTTSDIH